MIKYAVEFIADRYADLTIDDWQYNLKDNPALRPVYAWIAKQALAQGRWRLDSPITKHIIQEFLTDAA